MEVQAQTCIFRGQKISSHIKNSSDDVRIKVRHSEGFKVNLWSMRASERADASLFDFPSVGFIQFDLN